jgi:MSHA pilin protein MshD
MRGRSDVRLARPGRSRARSRGASLVELVVAIVVVSVVSVAVMGALGRNTIGAADALVRQQALVIGSSLLNEILAQGTDPSDPDGGADGAGPETAAGVVEARGNALAPFDHVNDYHGYAMGAATGGIVGFDGQPIAGLEGYSASVSVEAKAVSDLPSSRGWWVTVTVTAPNGAPVVLEGFRAQL